MAGIFESITDGLTLKGDIIWDPEDWLIFKQRLDALLREGKAKRISPPKGVDGGGYEWYRDIVTGDVYCYGSPNPPTLPEWKKFDPQESKRAMPNNFVHALSGIPRGTMTPPEAQNLKTILGFMVSDGRVERVPPRGPSLIQGAKESWYRDRRTGGIYRLVEIDSEGEGRWEQVPPEEIRGSIQ